MAARMPDLRDYSHAYDWLQKAGTYTGEEDFVAACLDTPGLPRRGIALTASLADCCRALFRSQMVLSPCEWNQRAAEAISKYRDGVLNFRLKDGS